jgi:hypothetical protein
LDGAVGGGREGGRRGREGREERLIRGDMSFWIDHTFIIWL